MSFPFNFIVIPAVFIATAYLGAKYTKEGLGDWYDHLKKPSWNPPQELFGPIWTFLYVVTALAVLWYWNVPYVGWFKYVTGAVLLANAYYNQMWSKAFFKEQSPSKALNVLKYLNATGLIATVLMAIHSPISAVMMFPYIFWVGFATQLNKEIEKLNHHNKGNNNQAHE